MREHVTVDALPDELLSEILVYATSSKTTRKSPPLLMFPIFRTCRRWRSVALASPRLWRHMKVTDRVAPQVLNTMLLRAKSIPIQLHWAVGNSSTRLVADNMNIIVRHARKIQGLSIDLIFGEGDAAPSPSKWDTPLGGYGYCLSIFPLSGSDFVALKTLEIRWSQNLVRFEGREVKLFGGSLPALEKLIIWKGLNNASFEPSQCPRLSHLRIPRLRDSELDGLWANFPQFSNLEFLYWGLCDAFPTERYSPTVVFSRLRTLVTTSLGAYYFLLSFQSPALEEVEIIPAVKRSDQDLKALSFAANAGALGELKSLILSLAPPDDSKLFAVHDVVLGVASISQLSALADTPAMDIILRLLAQPQPVSDPSTEPSKFAYCPDLTSFTILNAKHRSFTGRCQFSQSLKRLVEVRSQLTVILDCAEDDFPEVDFAEIGNVGIVSVNQSRLARPRYDGRVCHAVDLSLWYP